MDTVLKDSPAAKAGLKDGDIIKKVDGKDVQTVDDVQRAIIKHRTSEPVELVVVRGSKELNITVRLGELNESLQRK